MSERIEEKRRLMALEFEASQIHRSELLELIRTTPAFFDQLLAHVGSEKVESFLEKDEKYRVRKELIEKMKEEIFEEEMKEREDLLRSINLPDTLRRACVSATCVICQQKHNWIEIQMLGCGHVFHEKCIKGLRKYECPQCRRQIGRPMQAYGGGIFGGYRDADDY